jgi:hypothetical protein
MKFIISLILLVALFQLNEANYRFYNSPISVLKLKVLLHDLQKVDEIKSQLNSESMLKNFKRFHFDYKNLYFSKTYSKFK